MTAAPSCWQCAENIPTAAGALFATLEEALQLSGELITSGPYGRLIRVETGGERYYVKQYHTGGKYVRRFAGRSRVRGEWENLQLFRRLGIPTADLVAWGEELGARADRRGVVITREIPHTADLRTMVADGSLREMDAAWIRWVSRRLAHHVAHLHNHRFIHRDLNWRNVLVTRGPHPEVYLIDCPLGRSLFGPLLTRGAIKDLASLDRIAREALTETQRRRFFLEYRRHTRLPLERNRMARRVLRFFSREG